VANKQLYVMARVMKDAKGRIAIAPINRRMCAINDCGRQAAGLMDWPDIHTQIYLCQEHADYVRAIEHVIDANK